MAIRDEDPEASYGTHFFQDLIESNIFPVAVYPGKDDDRFDFDFFRNAANSLEALLPEEGGMRDYVKVIDVPVTTGGKMIELSMETGESEAMLAYLVDGA